MKIGLMGFEFISPNKGCEALSYAFLEIMAGLNSSNDEYVIFTNKNNIGDAQKYYPGINCTFVNSSLKQSPFQMIKAIRQCDIIFDVTMGDSFSDIYTGEEASKLIFKKRLTEVFNKHYILLPQTYGPFNIPSNEKKAMNVIRHAWKVYARDEMSIDYIHDKIPNVKIKLYTDLAFFLPYDKTIYANYCTKEKQKIGINVSGLLWRGGFTGKNQFSLVLDYQDYINNLINYYKKKPNTEVHLIPHVIDQRDNAHDDDYKVSKQLSEHYGIIIAPPFKNPIEAKSYIANMDCFIGSRMHSTVAAYTSGVPVIPVSYSRKFQGLFNNLGYNYIIDARNMNLKQALEQTIKYINLSYELKKSIKAKQKDIDLLKQAFTNEISDLLKQLER